MTVTAVDRAFQLLRAVPATDGTLSGLARETGLPIATVSRLMATLEQAGAVARDKKVYRIGPTVAELANGHPASYDMLSLATAHLHGLVASTGETAGIAEPVGPDYVHLGQVAAAHDVSVRDWTGFRSPPHAGCIGFVLMAHWDATALADYLGRPLERFSPATMIDPTSIERRLAQVRAQGWLWTTDEYAQGVTTVAAPILDRRGHAVGSLYVHGPSYRFPPDRQRAAIGRQVKGRADEVSAVLGWREVQR